MIEEAKEPQVHFMTFEEERAWAYSHKSEWDIYSCLTTAEKKGRAKGRAETNIQNAQKMKQKGFSAEDISDITGLTIEEIENL